MAYAAIDHVAVELGRPANSPEEADRWAAWLERVERTITRRFAQAELVLADQVALGEPSVDDVRDVEVAAVLRKIANPNGMTSVTRSLDDASITTRRDNETGADPLALTEDEWAILIPRVAETGGGAFSIRPYPMGSAHLPWCALNLGANYCSCGADIAGYPIYELDEL